MNHYMSNMALVITCSLIVLSLVLLLVAMVRKSRYQGEFYETIRGPALVPFFGNALDFHSTKDVIKVMMGYIQNYGRTIKGKIGPFHEIILSTDYRFLEFVLSSTKLLTKSPIYVFLKPWLGTGLLTADGHKWKTHRRALTPAFHFQILEQFIEVFESCGDTLITKFESEGDKNNFDVYPYVTLCSLDIICESIMGISVNAQNDENSTYVQSVKNMCRIITERAVSPIQMYDWLFPLARNYYTQKRALKILHKKTNEVINARRKELENKAVSENTANKKMFLDLLLQTKIHGRFLTNEEIREEVDTFMFEGHDTTASAISFIIYSLANNSEVQNQAFEEQQILFKDRNDEAVTYTDLQQMKYLEKVIKESLRLYPSVPIYGRLSSENVQFDNKKMPNNATILISAYGIHRDPLYFKDPEKFDPDRFENVDGKFPYAYIPFSAGPRNCIGQKFAMLEMKSVVSKVLRKFKLKPASPHHELQLVAETILKSANGIKIGMERRNGIYKKN